MPNWSNVDGTYNGYSGYSGTGISITDGSDNVGTLWAVLYDKTGNKNVLFHVQMDTGHTYTFKTLTFTYSGTATVYNISHVIFGLTLRYLKTGI